MKIWIPIAAVAVLALAACSSDDEPTEAGSASSTTTATTAATTTEPQPRPSDGCGAATAAATKEKHTLQVDGTERYYLKTVPARTADDDPMPLVVDIHGLAEGAEIHTSMSAMGDLAEKEGFAVVFPSGTGSPVRWDLDDSLEDNADLQLITAMLDEVGQDLCIDESRVYASGLSMGAMMSSRLACTMSDRFAAIAAVAGLQFYNGCNPDRAVPVLSFHGTDDPILRFNGGVDTGVLGSVLGGGDEGTTTTTTPKPVDLDGDGYPAAARNWAEHNGCEGSTDENVGEVVVLRTFDCPDGGDVEFYIVKDGGHTWPGSEFSKAIGQVVGSTTFDIDATELAWEFFQQFRLPASS